MTERTITQNELRASLANLGIHFNGINEIIEAAFPPLFTPKKGEIICVSKDKDFSFCGFRIFSRMNGNNGYDCFSDAAGSVTQNIIPWSYAKPQTPTQKGEG
jgi:hypothetical protein